MSKLVSEPVFLDANILVYYLDESSEQHKHVVDTLQDLIENSVRVYTSHHVIEEVLFIVYKLSTEKDSVIKATRQIAELPNLQLVEPEMKIDFAERYAKLWRKSCCGLNDALLIELVVEAGLTRVYSYDKGFLKLATSLGIEPVE